MAARYDSGLFRVQVESNANVLRCCASTFSVSAPRIMVCTLYSGNYSHPVQNGRRSKIGWSLTANTRGAMAETITRC